MRYAIESALFYLKPFLEGLPSLLPSQENAGRECAQRSTVPTLVVCSPHPLPRPQTQRSCGRRNSEHPVWPVGTGPDSPGAQRTRLSPQACYRRGQARGVPPCSQPSAHARHFQKMFTHTGSDGPYSPAFGGGGGDRLPRPTQTCAHLLPEADRPRDPRVVSAPPWISPNRPSPFPTPRLPKLEAAPTQPHQLEAGRRWRSRESRLPPLRNPWIAPPPVPVLYPPRPRTGSLTCGFHRYAGALHGRTYLS